MNIKNYYVILCVIMLVLLFFILNNDMCNKIYQLLKVFNDAANILSDIYYPTTQLFTIESLNIVGAFDNCITPEPDLISCIEVMKVKWLDYYKNISNIYLLGIIFYLCCKLVFLSDCLDLYYKCLGLSFDVAALIRDVMKLFYTLYDECAQYMVILLILILNKLPLYRKLQFADLVSVIRCYFKEQKITRFFVTPRPQGDMWQLSRVLEWVPVSRNPIKNPQGFTISQSV